MTMRKLLFILLTMLPSMLFAQKKFDFKRINAVHDYFQSKSAYALGVKHNKCFYHKKYSASQRHQFFPFNNADTIKLISYEAEWVPYKPLYDQNGKYMTGDTTKYDTVPILQAIATNHFALNKRKVKEIKTLTIAGINSLTNILFNFGYTPVKSLRYELATLWPNCYEPRNAVLFIDKKGTIMQYLEICFGCQHHFWSSSEVRDIEYCDNKYDLLRKYFLAQNIIYGADYKTID